jgi:hypothetical protein
MVTYRDGKVMLDNGNCRGTQAIVYFSSHGPSATAPCKPNEVDVVNVIGKTRSDAVDRLLLQPLKAHVVYRFARAGESAGRVVAQRPGKGTLSSWQTVTLVVAKKRAAARADSGTATRPGTGAKAAPRRG